MSEPLPQSVSDYEDDENVVSAVDTGLSMAGTEASVFPPIVNMLMAPFNAALGITHVINGAEDFASPDEAHQVKGAGEMVEGTLGAVAAGGTLASLGGAAAVANPLGLLASAGGLGMAIGDKMAPYLLDPLIGALTGHRPNAAQGIDEAASERNQDALQAKTAAITARGGDWHIDGNQLVTEYPDGHTERSKVSQERDLRDLTMGELVKARIEGAGIHAD